jgi:hypothetical protein
MSSIEESEEKCNTKFGCENGGGIIDAYGRREYNLEETI